MNSFYTRNWLNEQGTAFITSSITPSPIGKWCDAEVEIADCLRKVNISFEFGSKQTKKKKLKKLDLMISVLEAFRAELIKVETV